MNLLAPFINGPIAHRTLHDKEAGRPENSWEGLDAAINLGCAIEIDLQISRDGIPMVFHDYDLDRLTAQSGLIRDLDAHDLQQIILSGGTKAIPRFDDFMSYVAGQIPVLVELKDQDGELGPKLSELEPATCEILRSYRGDVALMSFNPDMIARCAMLAPNIPRGIVTDPYTAISWPNVPAARRKELAEIPHYDAIGASFISHKASDLGSDAVARVKAKGGAVFCWTVRSAKQEAKALKVADSITFEGYMPKGLG